MKVLYNLTEGGMSSFKKAKLTASLISSEDADLRVFANKYDFINNKYYGELINFASRDRVMSGLSRDFTTTTDINNQTYTALIAIVVGSITILSLGTYFYFRRKEK